MIKRSSLTFLYTIAILTVIGLIIGNQISAHYLLSYSKADANVINMAGRQRMLSQKIALESFKSLAEFQKFSQVKSDTEHWVYVHKALRDGKQSLNIPKHDSDQLRSLFKQADAHVDLIDKLVSGVNNKDELAVFVEMIALEAQAFLPIMDSIVQQYQFEAEARHSRLEKFEVAMSLLSILILGIVFFFIFRPIINELDKKNKKLKRANLCKDRLMSTIAHDLRNPINGIQGMVQIVREDLEKHLSSDHEMMFDLVDESCDKSTELIQELLEMGMLESDEFQIERQKIQLKEYLLQTIAHFKDKARQKGVELEVSVERDVLTVEIDQKRFGRVIDNLLTNALKFTSAPGKVMVESYEKPDSVILKVKDTGIGIPYDMQQYIFDKFSKARRQGLEGEQTTGLGMSIVKQIVELHEGKIWVESIEHVGTEFYIELPKVA